MIRLKIISIGKTKEAWLEAAIGEYEKRLKGFFSIEWIWAKDNPQLIEFVSKEAVILCLDPQGQHYTSEQFASFIQQNWEKGGSRLTFVIGGAEGLPESIRIKYPLISFSPLTFTHQMTRLLLIEQIYRSVEIIKGSNYHK